MTFPYLTCVQIPHFTLLYELQNTTEDAMQLGPILE